MEKELKLSKKMGANITVVVVPALYEFMEVTVVLGLGLELAVTHIR
jgi:hypothetical protein